MYIYKMGTRPELYNIIAHAVSVVGCYKAVGKKNIE